ncbi:hypothetical protein K1T71_006795 [Dendrolimus kikuchii]|uniref:Uncharacterized protein n=1 Tax=Dendrolimus kikuchii TaxID=765133 RepID=A0ACC1D3F1_9NEOP|nr:hypothetical protein K1T71_006795 [Dendrolimus kikuchii]
MDSIINILKGSYPKLHIEKRKSPSYIQMYSRETKNNEVVMVYAMNKSISSGTDIFGKDSNRCDTEELELTGSPLKLDLSLHTILDDTLISDEPQLWSKDEASHGPINIDLARDIANLFNKHRNEQSECVLPMWILIDPMDSDKPLLLTVQSNKEHFARGIVNYVGYMGLDDIDLDNLIHEYAHSESINESMVSVQVDCKYLISGISYGLHGIDELLNAPHGGVTELSCDWSTTTLETPFISCNVHFEQEVIIGHLASPCNAIWKSVCVLHNINQVLVDMNAAGASSVDLNSVIIRNYTVGTKRPNNAKRLKDLLNETETYAYTAEYPVGGCICINEDTSSLSQCLTEMSATGSSNDFTYKLWDDLRDCETAEELVTLLLQALKFISSGKIRPFIHVDNKTYLSKLVLKLSPGHSQAGKVLSNLRSSPLQALSLVAQVGFEKTMWEYTRVMSLLEHSFFMSNVWNTDVRTHESIEQINQTIQDMTMTGDFTLNPFESLSGTDHSIRLDCEPLHDEDEHELTIDVFTSLKKRGLVTEKKDVHEVPIITDEIDISPWKYILTKFAQLHTCLEHTYRAETCLRTDFSSLKQISTRLLEHYVSDRSPIKTVGQLLSDPVQKIIVPIANNIVEGHLKKPAMWYRVEMKRKNKSDKETAKRISKMVYVFSQQSVFPPLVWQISEQPAEEVAEVTAIGDELKYHCTKYTYISNKLACKLPI